MLSANTALATLRLSEAGIGDRGAEALAQGLLSSVSLRSLSLSHNRIGSRGAAAVAYALEGAKVNCPGKCPLVHLDLSHNFLADAGVAAMALALGAARTLRTLVLRDCDIGPPGAQHMAVKA